MLILIILSNFIMMFEELNKSSIEIQYHKNDLKINSIEYNGISYISINNLSKIFVMNNMIKQSEYFLIYKDEELIFSDLSFFIVYKSNSQMRVAQMSHPSIKINNELHIPINAFFASMNSLNLINSQNSNNKIIDIIDYSIFEHEIIVNDSNKMINKSVVIRKNVVNKDTLNKSKKGNKKAHIEIFEFEKNQPIERGKYAIPQSIKK